MELLRKLKSKVGLQKPFLEITMDHLFNEKNMADRRHSRHGEHKLSILNRFANSIVTVPVIFVMALCLGIPLARSTQESSQKATNKTVSAGIM